MQTWYKAEHYFKYIVTPVEVIKESESQLTLPNKQRVNKSGKYESYFRTEPEAIDCVKTQLEDKVLNAENQLIDAKNKMDKFKSAYLTK